MDYLPIWLGQAAQDQLSKAEFSERWLGVRAQVEERCKSLECEYRERERSQFGCRWRYRWRRAMRGLYRQEIATYRFLEATLNTFMAEGGQGRLNLARELWGRLEELWRRKVRALSSL